MESPRPEKRSTHLNTAGIDIDDISNRNTFVEAESPDFKSNLEDNILHKLNKKLSKDRNDDLYLEVIKEENVSASGTEADYNTNKYDELPQMVVDETNSGFGYNYDNINRSESTNTNNTNMTNVGKTDGDKTSIASARFPG